MLSYALQLKIKCIATSEFERNYFNIKNKDDFESIIKRDYKGLSEDEVLEAWALYSEQLKELRQN